MSPPGRESTLQQHARRVARQATNTLSMAALAPPSSGRHRRSVSANAALTLAQNVSMFAAGDGQSLGVRNYLDSLSRGAGGRVEAACVARRRTHSGPGSTRGSLTYHTQRASGHSVPPMHAVSESAERRRARGSQGSFSGSHSIPSRSSLEPGAHGPQRTSAQSNTLSHASATSSASRTPLSSRVAYLTPIRTPSRNPPSRLAPVHRGVPGDGGVHARARRQRVPHRAAPSTSPRKPLLPVGEQDDASEQWHSGAAANAHARHQKREAREAEGAAAALTGARSRIPSSESQESGSAQSWPQQQQHTFDSSTQAEPRRASNVLMTALMHDARSPVLSAGMASGGSSPNSLTQYLMHHRVRTSTSSSAMVMMPAARPPNAAPASHTTQNWSLDSSSVLDMDQSVTSD